MDTSSPPNQNFQITATMMAMAQDMQNDFDKDTLQIFTGRRKSCTFSTLGTVFIDCCADDPTQMLGTCTDTEIELAGDKRAKQVIFVGTMCTERWSLGLGSICAKKEDVYCSYNSKLARIIQQQGRPQLGQTFGTPEATDCDGFAIAEFASLDFQRMNFSEYFSEITSNFDSAAAAESLRQKACALDPSAAGC
jgi:conjugal transfer mating pair stabilization protein TraN